MLHRLLPAGLLILCTGLAATKIGLNRGSLGHPGIRQLAERYDAPLPQFTGEVDALAAKVASHLKKMGHEAMLLKK